MKKNRQIFPVHFCSVALESRGARRQARRKNQTAVLRALYRSLQSGQPAPTKDCLKVRISSDEYGQFSSQRNAEHFLGKCPCHQSYQKQFFEQKGFSYCKSFLDNRILFRHNLFYPSVRSKKFSVGGNCFGKLKKLSISKKHCFIIFL